MRWLPAVSLIASLAGSLLAQTTTIPVTGWYDGRGVENGFFDDGVAHGLYGLVGGGPLYPLWIPPFGTKYLTHLVRDPTQADACGLVNIGYYPSSILQIDGNLYVFLGAMHLCCEITTDDGPVTDPYAVIVRYGADGNYDLQHPLLYFPNPGIDPTPTSPTAGYGWGGGPLFAVMQGPTLPNGDSLYMFFGGVRSDQDTNPGVPLGNANGAHAFGIATSSITYDPNDTRHEARFNFGRGLSDNPRHVGWLDTTSPNYTRLRDAGVKVKRWSGTPGGVGQEVDGWFTPVFARIATRSYQGMPYVSRFALITGMYIGGYFYLFVGGSADVVKGTFSLRIPADPSQPYGLARNADGSIKVEMWYIDSAYPAGAFRAIDSTRPIAFTDDDVAGQNPPVPMESAFLRLTFVTPISYLNVPSGMFQYPAGSSTYFMTSDNVLDPLFPLRIDRLQYNASNALNPFSIATPYQIRTDGQGCTTIGNCTLPSRYTDRRSAVVYPLSYSTLVGFFDVDLTSCGGASTGAIYQGSGLLPFTAGGVGSLSLVCGDANGDGVVTVADIFYLENYLFSDGPAPIGTADVNSDGQVTVTDVFYLINYLFSGGAPPNCP